MKNENELTPIQYVIEHKNGIYKYSNSPLSLKLKLDVSLDKFNITTDAIRIQVIEKGENRNNFVEEIVKNLLIKGNKISLFSANSFGLDIFMVSIYEELKSINDLIFELIPNSKIEVTLFP